MVLVYMLTWIPSIYPSHVSIYTSTMDPMGYAKKKTHGSLSAHCKDSSRTAAAHAALPADSLGSGNRLYLLRGRWKRGMRIYVKSREYRWIITYLYIYICIIMYNSKIAIIYYDLLVYDMYYRTFHDFWAGTGS